MKWTSEEYERACRVLDARHLPEGEQAPPCTCIPGGRCHGVAVCREGGWPLCKLCHRRYLKGHRGYDAAINHAIRIVVDVEKGPRLVRSA